MVSLFKKLPHHEDYFHSIKLGFDQNIKTFNFYTIIYQLSLLILFYTLLLTNHGNSR
jgi:hypothetical protein